MTFDPEYVANLKLILNSQHGCISRSDFVLQTMQPHPNPDSLIAELIQSGLIETEENDVEYYFLTTAGQKYLEKNGQNEEHQKDRFFRVAKILADKVQKKDENSIKSHFAKGIMILSISISAYQLFDYPKKTRRNQPTINDKSMLEMKKHILHQIDSMRAIKSRNRLDSMTQVSDSKSNLNSPPVIEGE